jgi:hypothetical protein
MVNLKIDFDEIKKMVHQLGVEEREELLYELEPSLGEALQNMEKEVKDEEQSDETVSINDIK